MVSIRATINALAFALMFLTSPFWIVPFMIYFIVTDPGQVKNFISGEHWFFED